MTSRIRHQQGRISGILLAGVVVIFSPSGTDFYAVPEGEDGPAFCRHTVSRYARLTRKAETRFLDRVLRKFQTIISTIYRCKAGA
ncbi:hypothetical protein EGJ57_16180 [Brucella anthropi]|uniref:hypothetical protein n=1 Tax=Brucella anthropi TaxID=529 RepID=UPI000F6830EC|nr:hypothetical protein [Brucella anthropi]RRY17888.1 hypothetical protein EGJ57_16180 [Brucella anthropi]